MNIRDKITVFLFTVSAFILRLINIRYPDFVYFDETYYVPGARSYLTGTVDPNWMHPPLGKMIISFGMILFGDNSFGWRFIPAVCGTIIVLFTILLTYRIFKNYFSIISSGILSVCEILLFSMSRIALLDVVMTMFIVIAFYTLYLYLEKPENNIDLIIITAVFLGFSISCKWSGLFSIAAVMTIFSYYRKGSGKRYIRPLYFFLAMSVIPVFIYFLTYIPFIINSSSIKKMISNHISFVKFHFKSKFKHGYLSAVWSWFIMKRPIWFYYKENTYNKTINGLIGMGNPAFWWSFIICLIFGFIRFFKTFKISSVSYIDDENKKLFFILTGYVFNYVFWFISKKGGFFYYMLPSSVFMVLMVAYVLNLWYLTNKKILYYGYLYMIVVSSAFFYPVIAGITITKSHFHRIMWFRSWI